MFLLIVEVLHFTAVVRYLISFLIHLDASIIVNFVLLHLVFRRLYYIDSIRVVASNR